MSPPAEISTNCKGTVIEKGRIIMNGQLFGISEWLEGAIDKFQISRHLLIATSSYMAVMPS